MVKMTKKLTAIVELAVERFKESKEADAMMRREIEDDFKFAVDYKGHQWPAEIRKAREGDTPPRPCIVTNKIPEKIDQVEGEFRQMEPSVRVIPVDSQADPKIAEIRGGLIKHIEYQSTARASYNNSHTHVLYGGRGAWEIAITQDIDDPFVKNIEIIPIPNVLSVYWQKDCKKHDKSDSKYFFITEFISEREYKSRFKTKDLSSFEINKDTPENWHKNNRLQIAKYWWKEEKAEMFYRVNRKTDDGLTITLTVKEDQLRETDEIVDSKEAKVPWCRWGIITHDRFLSGPHDDWPSRYIPVIIQTGKALNVNGQVVERGMVRYAKDPARMYNYWTSSGAEMIALAPKSPYLVTPKMVNKHKDKWDSAHYKNYPYLPFDADPNIPGGTPKREVPPMISTAYTNELARNEHDIMAAMGIYQASLGAEGPEVSGIAIQRRQSQGQIGSFTFTDSFKNALIYSTKIINDLIPYVYDTERVIRILGDDDTEKAIPINARRDGIAMQQAGPEISQELLVENPSISKYVNDLTVGKYDIRITLGPNYTTQRQEAVSLLMELVSAVPQIGLATADLIVKNMDVPGVEELVDRVKKLIPPEVRDPEPGEDGQMPQQAPIDPKVMLEAQKLQLQIQEQIRKEFEAQINAIKALSDAESKEIGSQLAELTGMMKMIRKSIGE